MTLPPNSSLTARLLYLLEQTLGAGSPNSLSDVHAAVEAILGPVDAQVSLNTLLVQLTRDGLADLLTIAERVDAVRGVGARTLQSLLSEAYFADFATQLMSRLLDIEGRVDLLQAAIGAEPYGSLEASSVRGMLNALLDATRIAQYGQLPTGISDGESTGEAVGMGRVYAVFTPPIEGVTIAEGGINLTADWGAGWSYYIQTSDPSPQINTDPAFPNRWVALDYVGAVNFSVAPAYSIKAYLRAPEVNELCRVFSSSLQEGAQRLDFTPVSTGFIATDRAWAVLAPSGNWNGYTIRNLSGSVTATFAFGVDYMDVANSAIDLAPGQQVTVAGVPEPYMWTAASGFFSAEICPPQPS